jgi:hypothetical protein
MYECPNDCGSTTFVQLVKQQETVEVDDGGQPMHIDPNGNPVVEDLKCAECGAEVETDG